MGKRTVEKASCERGLFGNAQSDSERGLFGNAQSFSPRFAAELALWAPPKGRARSKRCRRKGVIRNRVRLPTLRETRAELALWAPPKEPSRVV